jgi:hypothetical protein
MRSGPRVTRRSGRLGATALAALLALALLPQAAAGAGSYSMNLAKPGDFVAQTNFVQCVGASMQMMLNMIQKGRDRTARTQLRLQKIARKMSPPRSDGRQRQGANVVGWTIGLNIEDGGPYKVVGTETLRGALKTAAHAMRLTRRPVGLLMWRGRHAWVMSGFRATSDPLEDDDYKVTAALVMDPLYPHGSVWGPSPQPGEALSPAELGRQYKPRRQWRPGTTWGRELGGKYILVLPYLEYEHPHPRLI